MIAMFRVREACRWLVSLLDREGRWVGDVTDGQTYGNIDTSNTCDSVHKYSLQESHSPSAKLSSCQLRETSLR
jgi:hypothetical protein